MSAVILCQVKQAEQPFYVNDVGISLYSAEELCWFMENNLPLLDRVFFEEPLQKWIRQELSLERLADTLKSVQEMDREPLTDELAMPVFDEIGWLTAEEREKVLDTLHRQELLPAGARKKLRADRLAGYRKYMMAIRLYREILSDGGAELAGSQLAGTIWHNMGVSYARMFQMNEACGCLRKAWDILRSDAVMKSLLCCCWLRGGREDLDRTGDDCGVAIAFRQEVEEELEQLSSRSMPSDLDQALRGWVEEYHRETGL